MSKQRILFAASEVYPFAKTGGLADVAHALPRALAQEFDVQVVMPLYRSINRQEYAIQPIGKEFDVCMGKSVYSVQLFGCIYEGIEYRFVYSPLLCEREFLYGPPDSGYEDNAIRFGIFNYAIIAILEKENYAIAHLNDWQCGLVPLLLRDRHSIKTKTMYTIHNLAYQGTFPKILLSDLGIDEVGRRGRLLAGESINSTLPGREGGSSILMEHTGLPPLRQTGDGFSTSL